MNAAETLIHELPSGNLRVSIEDADGIGLLVGDAEVEALPDSTTSEESWQAEFGDRAGVTITVADSFVVWPIDKVETLGKVTVVHGPKGTASFERAPQ